MKFEYVGEQESTSTLGYKFTKGIAVEITNEKHVKKLQGNKCFIESNSKPEAPKAKKPTAPKAKAKPKSEVSFN